MNFGMINFEPKEMMNFECWMGKQRNVECWIMNVEWEVRWEGTKVRMWEWGSGIAERGLRIGVGWNSEFLNRQSKILGNDDCGRVGRYKGGKKRGNKDKTKQRNPGNGCRFW